MLRIKQFLTILFSYSLIFYPYPLLASDIIVDQSSAQTPSVELAPNQKIPVVNIVKPNAQGLSHNKFKDYNVDKSGVILNNSHEVVSTQLAGYIMNNPNLANGENAKVILNEITGTKRSELLGYTEVAGKMADVIVANPNGIYINGGGFINVNAATLTTGNPKFKDGLLNGFDVSRGNIVIDGLGFNANNIDRVNLYASALALNAKLYAKALNVILGDNDINIDGSYVSRDKTSQGISLDSSALGGIYANTIFLTSSDKGLGVNLPPEVLAADTITLNAKGDILINKMRSTNGITITSQDSVTVTDELISSNADIKADNLYNKGEINTLNSSKKSVIDITNGIINHDNSIIAGYNLDIFANTISNNQKAVIYAKNDLNIKANTLYNGGNIVSDIKSRLDITNTLLNEGVISSNDLNVSANSITNNENSAIYANNNLNITTNSITNNKNATIFAKNDLSLKSNSSINNTGYITSWGNLYLDTNALINKGEINAINGQNANVNANTISNQGLIGGYNLKLSADDITNDKNSSIYAKNILMIDANSLTNEKLDKDYGYIRSDNSAHFNIKNTLYNKGTIYSKGNLFFGLQNQKVNILTNDGNAGGGAIEANGNITIFANELNNIADAPVYAINKTSISWEDHYAHRKKYVYWQTTSTEYREKANTPSVILSDGSINIDVNKLTNAYSLIAANEDIVINANEVKNIGKVAVTTVEQVISAYEYARCPKYRSHKWCDKWTSYPAPNITREPALNYGIQAGKTITGNIVNLKNIIYHIADPIKEEEIKANQEKIETLQESATAFNDPYSFFVILKYDLENENEDGYKLFDIENILEFNEESLFADYQGVVIGIKEGYEELLSDNLQALSKLEQSLNNLKNMENYKDTSQEIYAILQAKIDFIKTNIDSSREKLNLLQDVYDIFNRDDIAQEAKLLDILDKADIEQYASTILSANDAIKDLTVSSVNALDSDGFFNKTETVFLTLRTDINDLITKVNSDIALYGSVEDKTITSDEGLYQIGAANPTRKNKDVPYSEIPVNGVTIPTGKYGEFIASESPYYAVETNPLYTDFNSFIGSGYLQGKLNFNQEETFKRLGDGMYETRLIRDAIIAQTGNRYLDGYYSDTDQFQALMDNALNIHEDLKLTYGVALTYEQIASLDRSIVWMEEKEVLGQKVLVPVLYLASSGINNYGPKITAKENINLNIENDFTNKGYINAGNNLNINANSVTNTQGIISSNNDMNIYTKEYLLNQSGAFSSGGNMNILSDGTITSESLTDTIVRGYYKDQKPTFGLSQAEPQTVFVTTQKDTVIGASGAFTSGGYINIAAKDNINLLNTDITAKNNVNIVSDKNIVIGSQEEKDEYDFNFKGGFNRGLDVINHGSNIAGSNVNIGANNILIDTSNLNADNLLYLNAKENVDILAKNDVTYRDFQSTSKGGFGSKTTTRQMSYHEDTISSDLNAANILITSGKTTTLEAAKLTADENIYIDAKENINVVAKAKKDAELYMKSKSSFGGLKKSLDLNENEAFTLSSSDIETIADNIVFKSGKDINIIASNINSASDLQLEAFDNILIAAGIEKEASREIHESSSFNPLNLMVSLASGGLISNSIYQSDMVKDTVYDTTAKSSSLKSNNNIIIKSGSTDIVGSNLEANNNIAIKADTGHINILTAEELTNAVHEEKHIDVSLANIKDTVKGLIDNEKKGEDKDTKIKIQVASASFDEEQSAYSEKNHISSNLNAKNGNIILDSFDDIRVTGSNLEAKETIALKSQIGDITIQEAINSKEDKTKEKHAQADISITVQNEYAEIGSAVKAALESAEQLKKVKENYSEYKKEVKKLENTLTDLKEKYKNREAGITKEDIDDLQNIIDNIKDEEKYYVASIAAASADLATKTVAIASQTASAAASSGTWGFSVGLALDLQGSETKTSSQSTSSLSSNMIANNILLSTNTDTNEAFTTTTISGSNLLASNSIGIQTGNLNIFSSADTLIANQDTKDISGSVSVTMYGGGAGAGFSANYGESHSNQDYTYNTNSHIQGNSINIQVSNDANIKGATLIADDTFNMYVGNNLNVESVRDSYSSNSKGFNVGAGFSLGGDSDYTGKTTKEQFSKNQQVGLRTGDGIGSSNANFGINSGTYQQQEVILTSITGDKVSIEVGGNTNLKGSLIAAGSFDENGNFIDNKQLDLLTGTLTYSSLSSTMFSNSNSFGAGTNIGFSESYTQDAEGNKQSNTNSKVNSSNTNFATNMGYSSEKTHASLGQGTITIKDKENSDDINKIDRDTNAITQELYKGEVGTSVEASFDHRLLSKEGRDSIKEDIETTKQFANIIEKTITEESMSFFASDHEKGVSNLKESLLLEEAYKAASKDFMQTHPDEARILLNSEAKDEDRQKALNALNKEVAYQLGVPEDQVKIVLGKDGKGFTSGETRSMYIVKNNQENAKDEASTLFNEASDHYDLYNHAGIDRSNAEYKENRGDYSEFFGGVGADWLDFRYTTSGQNSLSTVSINQNYNSDLLFANTQEYNALDKNNGAYRQLNQQEIGIIDKHAAIFAKQLYGDNPTDFEIRDAKARLAQEALRSVDTEWSLILGGGKEYDKEAKTFLSNYNGMFEAKDIYEFNDGTTDGIYQLRQMNNEELQNLKDFTSQYTHVSTSSGIEPQYVYDAYNPYHKQNVIDGVGGAIGAAADFINDPFGSIAHMGVAIYEGKVRDHIVGSVEGATTFAELWLSPTLGQNVIDIYGQGQSGLGVQKFLHTGEALETGTYLFAAVGARAIMPKGATATETKIATANSVDNAVNIGGKVESGALSTTSVVEKYNPINPGPLSDTVANSFRSGTYTEVITTEPTILYRVYGGKAGEIGEYWTATKPTGTLQSKIDSALKPQWGNTATSVVEIEIPAGVRLYEGVTASQGGGLIGGGSQIFVPKEAINPAWIVK
jgi:filamentous hemagglutinin